MKLDDVAELQKVIYNSLDFCGKRLKEYEGPYWALQPTRPPFIMYTWKSGEGRHYSRRCPF